MRSDEVSLDCSQGLFNPNIELFFLLFQTSCGGTYESAYDTEAGTGRWDVVKLKNILTWSVKRKFAFSLQSQVRPWWSVTHVTVTGDRLLKTTTTIHISQSSSCTPKTCLQECACVHICRYHHVCGNMLWARERGERERERWESPWFSTILAAFHTVGKQKPILIGPIGQF